MWWALNRLRPIALAGFGAALLCNYWVLEGVLADRSDLDSSWISDLAARTEAGAWRFQLLAILSGLAIAAFALLLRVIAISPLEGVKWRSPTRGGGMVRWGLVALACVGAFAAVAGAAPLSCPEGIEPSCTLAEDPLDVVHALATGGEIVATVLAFLLLGIALQRSCLLSPTGLQKTGALSRAGRITLAIGAAWLALTVATGVSYLSGDVDAAKGALQRADQVLFGIWLALLGLWAAHCSEAPE